MMVDVIPLVVNIRKEQALKMKVRLQSITILAILTCIGCSYEGNAERNSHGNSKPIESKIADHHESTSVVDIGVATLSVPPSWQWIKSSDSKFGGLLVPKGTHNPEQAERLIQVHVGDKQLNLDESANGLANKFDGSVSELPFKIDGERALRISFRPRAGELLPHEGLGVVRKSTNVLFLAAARNADETTWPNLQQIATTLKWTDTN